MSDEVDYSFLFHAGEYDPRKAHEYYLRTRKLKGRQADSQDSPTGRSGGGGSPTGGHNAVVKNGSNSARLKAATEARVNALEARLEKLRDVLARLTEEAKARAGVEPDKKDDKKEAGSTKGGKSKLTAQERREAAKRSAEYRKKHPEKKSASEEASDIQDKIDDVKEEIKKMRAKLASAKASNSKSQTASKGR